MLLSSDSERREDGFVVEGVITQHSPHHVDSTPRYSEQSLLVSLPLGAFAVIKSPRGGAVLQAGESGEVAGLQESSVEPTGSVMIATNASGITRSRCDTGDACESVGGLEGA